MTLHEEVTQAFCAPGCMAITTNVAGFSELVQFGAWRIGCVLYHERISSLHPVKKMERHLETDEAFILAGGNATLFLGEDLYAVQMQPGIVYNVKKGMWHAITVDEAAQVFVIENEGTGPENTQYHYFE